MKVLRACLSSLWFWINVSAGVHILTFVFLSQHLRGMSLISS